MSLIGTVDSWAGNPLEVGPMYPWVGLEAGFFLQCPTPRLLRFVPLLRLLTPGGLEVANHVQDGFAMVIVVGFVRDWPLDNVLHIVEQIDVVFATKRPRMSFRPGPGAGLRFSLQSI